MVILIAATQTNVVNLVGDAIVNSRTTIQIRKKKTIVISNDGNVRIETVLLLLLLLMMVVVACADVSSSKLYTCK